MGKKYNLYNDYIPELKHYHFKDLLLREVQNLFKWRGLEKIIPTDILEKWLIEGGQVAMIEDDGVHYFLRGTYTGRDVYDRPTTAQFNQTYGDKTFSGQYKIYYDDIGKTDDLDIKQCVLIQNMEGGKSLMDIVEYYSIRLAMIWTSIDINLLWQNLPPIYSTADKDVKQSMDKILDEIWTGKPLIVADKALQLGENTIQVGLADVPFLFNDLHKAHDQILSDFRSIVGINTVGTVKESGVKTEEITANSQSIKTCLEVMYSQRKKAARQIKDLFGLDVSVEIVGGAEDGSSNAGVEKATDSQEL